MNELSTSPAKWRKHEFAILIGLLTLPAVFWVPHLFADSDDEADDIALLSGAFEKQQFVAGERVEITNAQIADDIFAAGRDLVFDTVAATNVIAAGMSLTLKSITADDLILGGGQIELSGNVKDDIVAAVCPVCPFGGRLHLASGTEVGDDARLAGRDVNVDGRIGGDLYVAARRFTLTGEVVGNANIEAERIVLVAGASIGGDLLYAGPTKPEIAEGVTIAGEVRQVESDIPFSEGPPENWIWYVVFIVLGFLLALILLGAVLQLVMPGLLSGAATTAVEQPWSSLGRGLVLALLLPASVALLMVTVIGIPIGMVAMASFFVLLALAFVAISYCIGIYARRLFGKKNVPASWGSRALWTAIGILLLVIVGLIPLLGWAFAMLAMIAGLGAVIGRLGPILRRQNAAIGTEAQ